MRLFAPVVVILGGCAQHAAEPSTSAPVDSAPAEVGASAETQAAVIRHLRDVEIGGVTAKFYGEQVPPGISPRYGIRELRFDLGDGVEVAFNPTGELHHSDWQFEIGSPDGAHVLLLQDRYGPYHIVAVASLADYLAGGEPTFEFGQAQPEGNAWVHEQGQWVSESEVSYQAGLTTTEEFRFTLE